MGPRDICKQVFPASSPKLFCLKALIRLSSSAQSAQLPSRRSGIALEPGFLVADSYFFFCFAYI